MSNREVGQAEEKPDSNLRNALLDLAKVVLPALIALAGQYITVVIPLQNQVKEQKQTQEPINTGSNAGNDLDVSLNNLYTTTRFLHSKDLWDKLASNQNTKNDEWDAICAARALGVLKDLGMAATYSQKNMASGYLNDEFILIECHSKNGFILLLGLTRKDDTIKKIDPLITKAVTGLELAYKGDLFSP